MEFKKNKFKVIWFYIIAFAVISLVLWVISDLFANDKNAMIFFAFGEIVLIASVIINKNALIGELNQRVRLNDNRIECKSFFVAGNLANASIEYSQIKSVEMKQTLFSHHLIIRVKGNENTPIVLNNQFEDYLRLWKNICDKCREHNPEACIDAKI